MIYEKCFAHKIGGRCIALKNCICTEERWGKCPFYKARSQALNELDEYDPPYSGMISKKALLYLFTDDNYKE